MKLIYFAWLRERLGINEEVVDLPVEVTTVAELFDWLKARDAAFANVLERTEIIQVAIDQRHERNRDASIRDAKEIALFPPMTGG